MFPRRAPEGALSQQQRDYLTWAVGMGTMLPGCVATMEYLDINLFSIKFRGPARVSNIIQWESGRSTYVVMHTTCATIIRHVLGASDDSPESFATLCEIEQILGHPCGGKIAGRFCDVDYKAAGRVDVERFWKVVGPDDGSNDFDWQRFQCSGLSWVIARPDVFPKFTHEVSPMRLAQIGCPKADTCDIITTQPVDILTLLLAYLLNHSLLSLLSTCRLLRHHALTTFQPIARAHTLDLGWAIPLEFEYKCAGPEVAPKLAHPTNSPQHGDWWLYLSHAHKKSSMRARRRIWALAHELRRAYLEKKPCSGYEDIITEKNGIKTRVFQT
ncbi:hypothetical protein CERSUDRAFT_76245 [Gelatoporia subvermispora B]|uniref:F-box domain-containing protein n=1 Tax=Ceriporiopsis subvermispora (strain B) TaxID=914234 RepID=M2QPM1_CERS8|nr:hypothetical protein CERSUDRAFT_76245 [Gelatoporia subvermispora B]